MTRDHKAEGAKLPAGFHFLEYQGRVIFPSASASGGIGPYLLSVVIQKDPADVNRVGDWGRESMGVQDRAGGRWHVVEMSYSDTPKEFQSRVENAIKALQA